MAETELYSRLPGGSPDAAVYGDPGMYAFRGGRSMAVPIILVALVIVVLVAWGVLWIIHGHIQKMVANELRAIVLATSASTHDWEEERIKDANDVVNLPGFLELAEELISEDRTREALLANPATDKLRKLVKPVLDNYGYRGIFLIAPDYVSVASMRDSNTGTRNLLAGIPGELENVFSGGRLIVFPIKSDVPLETHSGIMLAGAPAMFAGVPVRNREGEIIAAFALRIDPAQQLSRIAGSAKLGKTGETYMFNEKGLMTSEGRFLEQLVEEGILENNESGILNVKLHKPEDCELQSGERHGDDPKDGPLVQIVSRIIAEKTPRTDPVIVIDPYINYRGATVVGAGLWDPEGYGVITEIEASEVYSAYRLNRIAVICSILIISTAFIVLTIVIDRLRVRSIDANPLTGLPGNLKIREVIEKALTGKVPTAVVYCDLDNFKAYNDKYGFPEGDQVLRFTSKVIDDALKETCGHQYFLGHVGGDDFVFLVPTDRVEAVARGVARLFDSGIKQFYTEEDVTKNGMKSVDRRGKPQWFPIMTLSMAGVDTGRRKLTHYLEVSNICADVKKKAKSIEGTILFMDRRSD